MQAMKHQVTMDKFCESFFDLKKATRLLVSVSVFSIIVSYFSSLPFLLNSFKFSFSAYNSIDKNYVFLLCNGIVVFLSKNSGVFKSNSPQKTEVVGCKKVIKKRNNRGQGVKLSETKESIIEKSVVQETEILSLVAKEKQEEENEFEDEEGNGYMSREELNKKCDDFIREMKKVINFEV